MSLSFWGDTKQSSKRSTLILDNGTYEIGFSKQVNGKWKAWSSGVLSLVLIFFFAAHSSCSFLFVFIICKYP